MTRLIPFAFALFASAAPALAQQGGGMAMMHEMDGMMMMMAPDGASAATQGYVDAMNGMSAGMMMEFTGDADVDFIKGMIPHHQGAIDMALLIPSRARHAELLHLSDEIIKAQTHEIDEMRRWEAAWYDAEKTP